VCRFRDSGGRLNCHRIGAAILRRNVRNTPRRLEDGVHSAVRQVLHHRRDSPCRRRSRRTAARRHARLGLLRSGTATAFKRLLKLFAYNTRLRKKITETRYIYKILTELRNYFPIVKLTKLFQQCYAVFFGVGVEKHLLL